jgi:hypothetical protein
METSNPDKGVIDLSDRILKELLKKPAFKDGVRTVINNIDPASSRQFVRTLLWQDPEFFLGLISALPPVVNAALSGIDELLIQLQEKISPLLLHDYLRSMALCLDSEALERIIKNGKELSVIILAIADEVIKETADQPIAEKGESKTEFSPVTVKSSVIKEILATPFVKDLIRANLKSAAIESDPSLVRTLLWEDPEVSLSVLSTLPHLVNRCTGALSEAGREIDEKFSPELLQRYLTAMSNDINTDNITAGAKVWGKIITNLWDASPEFRKTAADNLSQNLPRILGTGITSAARFINEIDRQKPLAVSRFLSNTLDNMDAKEVEGAARILFNALLDHKSRFLSWKSLWRFFRDRQSSRKSYKRGA